MNRFLKLLDRYYIKRGNLLELRNSERFPIAKQVPAPDGLPYEKSVISVKLTGRKLSEFGCVDMDSSIVEERADEFFATVKFLPQALSFELSVDSREDIETGLDSGGALGFAETEEEDPEHERWLETARGERTKLAETENGRRLLEEYGKHNAVYEEIFRTSTAMQMAWTEGGVVKQMSADTNNALLNDDYINEGTYGGASYNDNAFVQKLALSLNTLLADDRIDPFEEEPVMPKDGKYYEASCAVELFATGVETTGNTKTETKPLKAGEVYAIVEKPPVDFDTDEANVAVDGARRFGAVSDSQRRIDAKLSRMLETVARFNNAARLNNADRSDTFSHTKNDVDTFAMTDTSEYSEKEIKIIKASAEAAVKRKMSMKNDAEVTVSLIPCRAVLTGTSVRIRSNAAGIRIEDVFIPEFEIEFDEKPDASAAEKLAVEKFGEMRPLHKMIHDSIAEAVSKSVAEAAGEAFDKLK